MNAYIRFIIKRPLITLGIFIAITLFFALGVLKLQFDTTVEAFLPKQDSEYQFYNQVKEIYGDTDTYIILAVAHDNLWSRGAFTEIDHLLSDIEEYQHYNESREKERLDRLNNLLLKGTVTYEELFHRFENDPVFTRFLHRAMGRIPEPHKIIGERALRRLRKQAVAARDLKKSEMIDRIISPFTSKDIVGQNDTLETVRLIQKDAGGNRILPQSEAEFAAFRQLLQRNPAFLGSLYSRDAVSGKITDLGFVIRFRPVAHYDAISREILNILNSYTNLKIIPQGQPLIYIWTNNYVQRDLFNLLSLAMLVSIVVCTMNFGSIRSTVLPLICLGMASCWVLGLMGHLGFKITTIGMSIPPLMIVVGSSYAIHILNQYYTDFDLISRKGKVEGLFESMGHIGHTVFLAGLTTLVSFLTLAGHQLSAMREWGVFSATGVLFAIFISVSVIPASLALMPHRKGYFMLKKERAKKKPFADKIISWATKGAVHHPKKVLAVVAVLLCLSLVEISKIKIETEFLQNFKETDPIRTSEKIIGEKFGGRWGFNILIDSGTPDGVKSAKYLKALEDIRTWLESDANRDLNVGRTDGFTDFIKTMHMAMNDDDPAFFAIPESDADIKDYLEIYSDDDDNSDGRPDSFEPYVDAKFRTCNILTRIYQKEDYLVGTFELKRIFAKISEHLEKTIPPPYTFRITGHPAMVIKSAGYIADGQIQSLWQSWVVVGIAILILVRSFLAGFLALIPLSVAFIINFGIMGLFGIRLDVATSVIAAITIGIGDDNTIHFINTYIYQRKKKIGATIDETIAATHASA
ncbi:MAG: MMPL family transporter, partial [Desulfosalsimonadaceae bacterium]|nr:MMPL family transporter [Desulfosalsimonadaceae bacterium]